MFVAIQPRTFDIGGGSLMNLNTPYRPGLSNVLAHPEKRGVVTAAARLREVVGER